jgi:hypothetical protein
MVKFRSGIQIARGSLTSQSIDDSGADGVVWRDGEGSTLKNPGVVVKIDRRLHAAQITQNLNKAYLPTSLPFLGPCVGFWPHRDLGGVELHWGHQSKFTTI